MYRLTLQGKPQAEKIYILFKRWKNGVFRYISDNINRNNSIKKR